MRKAKGFISDMDGTLYTFRHESSPTFDETQFMQRIHDNALAFFRNHFGISQEEALLMYRGLRERFQGEISIGLEREHGIPRGDYFAATWGDMRPSEFVDSDPSLAEALGRVTAKRAVLSAAPMVWMDKVLEHLGVRDLFEPAIFSGDPDIRKPDPEAFLQVARFWDIEPESIVSVGDLEKNDILPAKQAGMMTVRIGNDPDTQADFSAPDFVSAITLLKKEGII